MRGSDFAELQALSSVVRFGSFSAAAAELRMSNSALSQVIRKLEQRLGLTLLIRTTRSVRATECGMTLLRGFEPAAAEIEMAVREAQEVGGKIAGRLCVHAQRLAFETVLAPSLAVFLATYPDVVVEVKIDDAPVDIVAEGFDVGLRLGELLDADMISLRLGEDLRQVAVAAPAYLAGRPLPQHPKDLLDHRCILFRWPGSEAVYNWEFADPDNGEWFSVPITGPLVLSEQRATIEAAVAGIGIAFWVGAAVRSLVETGQLVTLLDQWARPFPGFSLFYPSARIVAPAVRALIDHLRASRSFIL